MLSVRVIPCLDVDAGRVVKGVQFKEIRDAGDPVEIACAMKTGEQTNCVPDITASSDERETMRDVVERTVETCFMPVTVGGGIRKLDDVTSMLLAGADKVSMNTAAILNPKLVDQASSKFGNQCIVVAIDAKSGTIIRVGSCTLTVDGMKLSLMQLSGQRKLLTVRRNSSHQHGL